MENATSTELIEEQPSEDQVAQVLGLPEPEPAYDDTVSLKVYATDVEMVRLVARKRGYFTKQRQPNIAQAMRDSWDVLVAEGKELREQAQRQLQNTGT